MQPLASNPHGGELITITGTGLSFSTTVDIDGIPCKVINSSFSEIKCITGAAPAGHPVVSEDGTYPDVQEGYRFKGECIRTYAHLHIGVCLASCIDNDCESDIDFTEFGLCVYRWSRCHKQGVSGYWPK